MADSLVANNADAYLTPLAVVNRLKSEFSYVEADGEEGRRHVLEIIERLKADGSRRHVDHQVVERLARVKNRALFVCFGDDAGSDLATLETYIVPGMPLAFEYASVTHENVVQHLLTRCAQPLSATRSSRIAASPMSRATAGPNADASGANAGVL